MTEPLPPVLTLPRAWYWASIPEFLAAPPDAILGHLAHKSDLPVLPSQRDAWLTEISILQRSLPGLEGAVLLEFNIPRMGRRIDTVLLLGPTIFVVEFKAGEDEFAAQAIDQVWDYALDLKNFHEGSHSVPIVPVLIPTQAQSSPLSRLIPDKDGVYQPIRIHSENLRELIDEASLAIKGEPINGPAWLSAPYRPTPTIVEAARALYAQHSVAAIARYDAGAQNLSVTSRKVEELVDEAQRYGQKVVCFVTGVPGAGKTLVGLNIATRRRKEDDPTHAVYLSGNGPLVAVLREALTRDEVSRQKELGKKVRKGKVAESVKAFIQNVHHFRDEALTHEGPPAEHVVIFDEAQRAWNLKQTAQFMSRKKNYPGFSQSEAEFLLSYLDRHKDWAFVVCLVGGGQEINTGEAGIDAWLNAIRAKFAPWRVYISSRLGDNEYAAGEALQRLAGRPDTYLDDDLHLAASIRSFRAENVSAFVKALLDCERRVARETLVEFMSRYPIALTRDLRAAKKWVRDRARGTERYGLVASSKAQRLKPHAIDIRVEVDPRHWFLNDKDDARSSFYLEDAATEFQVQGLELDWVCVSWDADLRFIGEGWSFHDFRGYQWCNIGVEDNKRYLRNAYRVLLTRARQGMVIFVPRGDREDATRQPEFYDPTYAYLQELGIPTID